MLSTLNINDLINFELVQVHSSKKNKDYYAIAIVIDNQTFILKFLTLTQAKSIIKA